MNIHNVFYYFIGFFQMKLWSAGLGLDLVLPCLSLVLVSAPERFGLKTLWSWSRLNFCLGGVDFNTSV